ncbi:MAG: GDSL-type esterase/lipase family protein [Balneolales bacterium]|nr:GDSL-type esterase/lipase family protein [Balneolales bacterium]
MILGLFQFSKLYSQEHHKILAIGDSNGASENGWVIQLSKMRPNDTIINVSVPGNTIGFDNLNQERLNTLKNVDKYVNDAFEQVETISTVLILLGTNDSKAVFDGKEWEVVQNLKLLVANLRVHISEKQVNEPIVVVVSPPPYGPDEILAEKYLGGNERVKFLAKEFDALSKQRLFKYVNIYEALETDFMKYSHDGVHLDSTGQKIIAEKINVVLNNE